MSVAGLSESETEWLSLIRYQVLAAGEATRAPAPLNTLAINAMQDAVDSVLQASAQHLGAAVPARADFAQLLDRVAAVLQDATPLVALRSSLIALNAARVGFKHHGNQIRDETIRRHYDVTVTAVDTIVRAAFGVELDEVSLLQFVRDPQARELLASAQQAAGDARFEDSLYLLRLAFDLIVDEYEARKSIDGWRSIFDTHPTPHLATTGAVFRDPMTQIGNWVETLDRRVRLISLGVDLQRFAYFDTVAPVVHYIISDPAGPQRWVRFEQITSQHFADSWLFVLDTALRLGATDYTLQGVDRGRFDRSRYRPDRQNTAQE